ncbi:MAG: ABC transporter permease [Acidobacteria bacterium]|nr:ABC transporter permease [Acidobacteriota bacterium]
MNRDRDDEIREELDFHEAARADLLRSDGMTGREASAEARKRFGNRLAVEEEVLAVHAWTRLEQWWSDVRLAVRGFARNPVLAATAVVTLALGIGPAAAVFSVVDRILYRPLPYPGEARLASFGMKAPIEATEFLMAPAYFNLRGRQGPFEMVTSWTGRTDCDLTEGEARRLSCGMVEASFLETLGVAPLMGRGFTKAEDKPGAARVALLTYALWRSRFGREGGVIGRKISLDGQLTEVVGVLPESFEMPTLNAVDVLVPAAINEAAQGRQGTLVVRAFGRLREGISMERAAAELQPWFQDAMKDVPPMFRKEVSLRVRPLRDRQVGDSVLAARLLLGAVLLVLLLACANVANLLIARGVARELERAIRATLGASRWRIARQSLVECLLLAMVAAAAGLALAGVLIRVFAATAPGGIPRLTQAALDGRVGLFTLGAAMLCAALFAVASMGRTNTVRLGHGARTTRGRQGWLRIGLVSFQIAVSVVLLQGSLLLLRSFWNVQNTALGFDGEGLMTAQLVLGQHRYPDAAARVAFFERVEERLAGMPGVASYAVSDSLPPSGQTRSMIYSMIDVEGREPAPQGTGGMVGWRAVTPGYFRTLSIPVEQGRAFQEADRIPGQDSVVVSRALARRLFGDGPALGKRLRFGRIGPWFTIVGVAADVRNGGLTVAPDPEYYLARKRTVTGPNPGLPDMQRRAFIAVRTSLSPEQTLAWLRTEIRELDPALPVEVESMEQRVGALAARPKFMAFLATLFSVTGIVLAAVGLYGVMAFLVSGRTREIGIRMAMGATPSRISRMVLGQAGVWVAPGIAAGGVGVVACAGLLRSQLYQVGQYDGGSIVVTLGVLTTVALVAAHVPARRASRVDPSVAVREE